MLHNGGLFFWLDWDDGTTDIKAESVHTANVPGAVNILDLC